MFNNKEAISLMIIFLMMGFIAGYTIDRLVPRRILSDVEVFDKVLEEYEFYMKTSGMWDKKINELPTHMNNNKGRVLVEIDRFRGIACNKTNLLGVR